MSRQWALVPCVLLAAGCIWSNQSPPPSKPAAAPGLQGSNRVAVAVADPPEFDVYEGVVRHYLKNLEDDPTGNHWALYVSVPDGLSDVAFCRRFPETAVPVRPFSGGVKPAPHQTDFFVHLQAPSDVKIHWQGPDQASVAVLAFPDSPYKPSCGTPWPMTLQRDGKKWLIVER